ncbi:MAG: polysaccharide biosynthesis C-terminal domain-containing protein [Phaeodactylibacter sp.]|uniref:lipopolysaccharide biosynthesis protein n=1 Tax=Phaeodactylibacter sp. TaxID=1940289 RepID=UPI0032EBA38B
MLKALLRIDKVKAMQGNALLRQGSAILISILLAKTALSKEGIGWYEQLLYVGYVLTSFWVTGLMQALLSRFSKIEPVKRAVFLTNVAVVFGSIGAVLMLGFWWGRHWFVPLLTGQADLPFLLPFLLFLWLNLATFLLENFYLLWDRPGELLIFGALTYSAQLIAVVLPVWLGQGLETAVWALAGIGGLRFIWLLARLGRVGQRGWHAQGIRMWLTSGWPLVLYAGVGTLSLSFDPWLVNYHFAGDPDMFAVFRYGARELPLAMALAAAFGTAMLPGVSANLERALPEMRQKSLRLYHLLFPLTLALLLSSRYWFTWVFSEAFEDSIAVFNVFLLVLISRMLFPRTVLIGLDANRAVFYFSLVELGLNVVLGFLLVVPLGLLGIAWATVIAYTVDKLVLCAWLYYRFGIAPGAYTPVGWWAGYTLLLLLSYGWTL